MQSRESGSPLTKLRIARVASMTVVATLLIACNGDAAAPGDVAGAAKNVEAYLQARVSSNVDQMISLSCAAWESKARVEATSFQSMQAQLEGVACTATPGDANAATVNCSGRILTSYNGESREWKLDARPFASTFEGGEWRMCGYR
jgi:hypothetical protein